jgi:porin
MRSHKILSAILAFTLILSAGAIAQTASSSPGEDFTTSSSDYKYFSHFRTSNTLTGDWNGIRGNMELNGIELEAAYTGEYFSNVAGGIERNTAYLDNIDIVLGIDLEQFIGLRGGLLNLYVLANSGDSPSEYIGDAQVASNIDTDDTWKLYELWYEQLLLNDRFSIRAGLYDLNSEFDAIETASLFHNSSHGIGPDYSQSGINGPSIFATTSLALRAIVSATDNLNLMVAALDGTPGDPEDPYGTHVRLEDDDGVLLAGEVSYVSDSEDDPYMKLAIGGWAYTNEYEYIDNAGSVGTGNAGAYLLAERQLSSENSIYSQGLAAFGRIGIANTDYNQLGTYFGTGIVYTGLLPGRDEDKLGVAIAAANNSSRYKNLVADQGSEVDNSEVNIELSYSAALLPWLVIEPDIQYIVNPGFDPSLDNAFAVSLRFSIGF